MERTHVNSIDSIKLLNSLEVLRGIGYVESYDFSKANTSYESRVNAVTTIASVCYQSPKAMNSINLFNRLECESHSLPSSSFEFVPMLFRKMDIYRICLENNLQLDKLNISKFGETITEDSVEYLLTNYRAVVYDFENHSLELRKHYNTEEECNIIAKHFKVFRFSMDTNTRAQFVRHRVNLQELSRRYVSGKRVPFDFYISEKMEDVITYDSSSYELRTRDILDICLNHYYAALEKGIKPEEARRIIPQAMMTTLWAGFQPTQLENFYKLRLDSHAQKEIREIAEAMKGMENES